ncbi:hypothetical protein R9X47_02425 [Wukongibacter baidiensis]|uniref:hypothetical protein n=1 Tax=Wukongibacter baidiensis TaxID=1723361 RepID=UPI003D7F1DB6
MKREQYRDEEILKARQEQDMLTKLLAKKERSRRQIQEIKEGCTVISKEEVFFERKNFFKGFISLMLPTNFSEKEADGDAYIYNSFAHDIHIIISFFNKKAEELELKHYKEQVAKNMKKEANTDIQWLEEGLFMENGYKITYVAFTCPVEESFIYNFIFFTTKGEKTVIINFNCMEHQLEDWETVGKAIMQTVEVY